MGCVVTAGLEIPWLSPWKLGVGAMVLATSGVTKVASSFPDMTVKQILTSGSRYSSGFIINNVLSSLNPIVQKKCHVKTSKTTSFCNLFGEEFI